MPDAGSAPTDTLDGAATVASTDDAGSPPPSSTDASATPDASNGNPPTFCKPGAHQFCWDFEDGKAFDATDLFTENDAEQGTVDVSTDVATSGTHSVKVHMPRRKGTAGNAVTQLYHNETAPWTKTHIEVSFYIVPPMWRDGDLSVAFFGHVFYSDQGELDGYGVFGKDTSAVGAPTGAQVSGPALPTGVWLHAVIDFDPTGPLKSTINGVDYQQMADPSQFTPTSGVGQGAGFGIFAYQSPTPDLTVYFDDFTIDW